MRRDPATGDVILSRRPPEWEGFFELLGTLAASHGFLLNRQDAASQPRDTI